MTRMWSIFWIYRMVILKPICTGVYWAICVRFSRRSAEISVSLAAKCRYKSVIGILRSICQTRLPDRKLLQAKLHEFYELTQAISTDSRQKSKRKAP